MESADLGTMDIEGHLWNDIASKMFWFSTQRHLTTKIESFQRCVIKSFLNSLIPLLSIKFLPSSEIHLEELRAN